MIMTPVKFGKTAERRIGSSVTCELKERNTTSKTVGPSRLNAFRQKLMHGNTSLSIKSPLDVDSQSSKVITKLSGNNDDDAQSIKEMKLIFQNKYEKEYV